MYTFIVCLAFTILVHTWEGGIFSIFNTSVLSKYWLALNRRNSYYFVKLMHVSIKKNCNSQVAKEIGVKTLRQVCHSYMWCAFWIIIRSVILALFFLSTPFQIYADLSSNFYILLHNRRTSANFDWNLKSLSIKTIFRENKFTKTNITFSAINEDFLFNILFEVVYNVNILIIIIFSSLYILVSVSVEMMGVSVIW